MHSIVNLETGGPANFGGEDPALSHSPSDSPPACRSFCKVLLYKYDDPLRSDDRLIVSMDKIGRCRGVMDHIEFIICLP